MRTLSSVVVSSALLFALGAVGAHPVSAAMTIPGEVAVDLRAPVLITGFYPCAVNGDECLVLSNRGSETVNLLNWSVCDGEGSVKLPSHDLRPGGAFALSENRSSYRMAYGSDPDLSVDGWAEGVSSPVSGSFRLSDAGEVVWLEAPDGALADVVAYGEARLPVAGWEGSALPSPRQGEVVRRLSPDGSFVDTDNAADWMHFREFRYGHTEHPAVRADVAPGSLVAFTSPDCSLDVVCGAVAGAVASIRLCSYELSSAAVCGSLIDARARGVDVKVLVDANPVGGMSIRQMDCLSALASAGVDVRVLGGSIERGVVKHVGVLHAKYMTVDCSTLVVLSENFVEDGVPVDRLFGNRGWGVLIEDGSLASFACAVFDDDSREDRADVWAWAEDTRHDPDSSLPEVVLSHHPVGMLAPYASCSWAEVRLHVSPDASPSQPFLSQYISDASSIMSEQFRADLLWSQRWSSEPVLNPLVRGIAGAIAGGGDVRGLFDGSWYNAQANGEVVAYLSEAAIASGRVPSFGLLAEGSPVTSLHNKGMVLDDRSLVSSNNWVCPSFSKNREFAVMVDGGGVSSYFASAFQLDWVPDASPPVAKAGEDLALDGANEVTLDGSSSWDDRAIAGFSWDFDNDGVADAFGPMVAYTPPSAGTHLVRLHVVDAWGNTATDELFVIVSGPGDGPVPGVDGPSVHWLLPAASSCTLVALLMARKLNLLRHLIGRKG